MEEYYKLDYEDLVGDLPTRFNYRKVEPESKIIKFIYFIAYGLKYKDILLADEEDLNDFISLKRLAPYRRQELVEQDKKHLIKKGKIYAFKAKLKEKKKAIKKELKEKSQEQIEQERLESYAMPSRKKRERTSHESNSGSGSKKLKLF